MPRFTMPRDVHYGRESIERLSELRGKRAMLVAASEEKKEGAFARAETALRRTGMEVRLLESPWPEYTEQAVAEGASAMRAFAPDWIVAFGSMAIDAAKLMWILYEYPEAALSDLHLPFSLPDLRRKARFAAIPSLGGISEATALAEFCGTAEQNAWAAADYGIVPDIAFVDPVLSESVQPTAVAQAGMETLAYAVGAYAAWQGSPFTEAPAQKAAELVLQHLCAAQGGDSAAREQIQYAACLSGMAFSNALSGLTHALARQTAAVLAGGRAQRGALNAVFLPHVIRFNAEDSRICARYARLARALGLRGRADTLAVQALTDEIEALRATLKLACTLRQFGSAQELEDRIPTIAARAAEDFCTQANPRAVSKEDALEILRAAFGKAK